VLRSVVLAHAINPAWDFNKKDVADLARESNTGGDTEVKEFAAQTLLALKAHLQQAEQITPGTKGASAGTGSSSE